MDTELHRLLEEAAERASIEEFNNTLYGTKNRELADFCKDAAKSNFKRGCDFGVRLMIALCCAWMQGKKLTSAASLFSSDMNKLWEGDK